MDFKTWSKMELGILEEAIEDHHPWTFSRENQRRMTT